MVWLAVVWLVIAQAGSVARAGTSESGPPPRVVTLDEALGGAEATPEVAVAAALERLAEAGVRSARAPAEPTLTIATRSITARQSLAASVPFRWGGQRASSVAATEAERVAASRSRDAARAQALRVMRTAWYALAAAEDLLRAADDRVSRSERNRRAISDLFELQRASRLDAARAAAEAAMAVAARAEAEREVATASAELRALLGYADLRLSAGAERPKPPPEGELAARKDRARVASIEIVVAEAQLAAAEARLTERARQNRPATTLAAGADWNDPTQPGTDVTLGLGLTFPTRGRAAVDAARAERDRAAAALELARRRVDAEVESAWSSVRSARSRFEAVDGVASPAASEAAELTRIAYGEGKLDLFRLLDAERALAEAERDRAEAFRDWGAAAADLLRLAPEDRP